MANTPDFHKIIEDANFEDEAADQAAGYKDPKVGDLVHLDTKVTGKVSGVIRAVYSEGEVISIALNNDTDPEILSQFVRSPDTGMVHIIAEPREYEIYGRIGL